MGLLPDEDLRYYLNTCLPDDRASAFLCIAPINHVLGPVFLSTREVVNGGHDVHAVLYFLNECMDLDVMNEILATEVLHKDPYAQKWLEGKSEKSVWRRYGFLSYMTKRLYCSIVDGHRILKFMWSEQFQRSSPSVRQENAMRMLMELAGAGGPVGSIDKLFEELSSYSIRNCSPAREIAPILRMAAMNGHTAVVKYLVEKLALDPMRVDRNDHGSTLAHVAASSGRVDTLRFVCRTLGVKPDVTNELGYTPMHSAATGGGVECVQYLADECGLDPKAKDAKGHTPVMFAAMAGNLELVTVFAEKYGCNLRDVDADGGNVLHWAMTMGQTHMIKPLVDSYKLDVHAKTHAGQTPAHYAVFSRSREALQALIDEHGADPHAVTRSGATLAHFAARYRAYSMITLLHEYEVDFFTETQLGHTCMHWAKACGDRKACSILKSRGMKFIDAPETRINLDPQELFGLSVPKFRRPDGDVVCDGDDGGDMEGAHNLSQAAIAALAEEIHGEHFGDPIDGLIVTMARLISEGGSNRDEAAIAAASQELHGRFVERYGYLPTDWDGEYDPLDDEDIFDDSTY